MEHLTTSAMIVLMELPVVAQAIGVECQVPVQARNVSATAHVVVS